MQRYKCRACAFTFSEADRSWDSAIDFGRCPNCSELLSDFPVPVRGQRQSALGVLESEKTKNEPSNVVKASEEDLYATALAEVQSGTTRPGLWAKAFAESEGDENKSKALYIRLRVEHEQKAADALAAETVRRKEAGFQSVLDQLRHKGYEVKRIASGWAMREPLGGRVKFDSGKSLLEYAQRYGIQPLPPGEHPVAGGRVAVAPELRDSFSSKSAERADEKSGQPGEGTLTAMTNYERTKYFFLAGISFVFLFFILASRGLAGIAAENLATAAFALGLGWSLNNKTRRLALSRFSYITLCVVYLFVANTLAVFRTSMPFPSNASDEKGAYYLLLLTVIAYVFTWVAIKTNKQKPNGSSESRAESTHQSSVDSGSAKEPAKKENQPFRAMIAAGVLLCVVVVGMMTLFPKQNDAPKPKSTPPTSLTYDKIETFKKLDKIADELGLHKVLTPGTPTLGPSSFQEAYDKQLDTEHRQAIKMLSRRYPDWAEIVGPENSQTEYRKWLAKQPPEYQAKILDSWNPGEVANSIDKFKKETK